GGEFIKAVANGEKAGDAHQNHDDQHRDATVEKTTASLGWLRGRLALIAHIVSRVVLAEYAVSAGALNEIFSSEELQGASFKTTTMPLVDSFSPRRRSGERGFQLAAPIRWKVPLSPLVPRRERERGPSTMVVVSRCAQNCSSTQGELIFTFTFFTPPACSWHVRPDRHCWPAERRQVRVVQSHRRAAHCHRARPARRHARSRRLRGRVDRTAVHAG